MMQILPRNFVWAGAVSLVIANAALAQDRVAAPPKTTASSAASNEADLAVKAIASRSSQNSNLSLQDTETLLEFLTDVRLPREVRGAALRVACLHVAPADAIRVVEALESILPMVWGNGGETNRELALDTDWLTNVLIGDYGESLQTRLGNSTALLDLYLKLMDTGRMGVGAFMLNNGFRHFVADTFDVKTRQKYVVAVARRCGHIQAALRYARFVDDSVADKLRAFAFGPGNASLDPKEWNRFALDLLAEVGDRKTGEMLVQKVTEAGGDVSVYRKPGMYLWRIDARHDPSMLLDCIRSLDERGRVGNSQQRALFTALRWGLDGDEIAAAVRALAQKVSPNNRGDWTSLQVMKQDCVDAGIMTEKDLPDVPPLRIRCFLRKH